MRVKITLEADSKVIALSESLHAQAFQLYRGRRDKEWGVSRLYILRYDEGKKYNGSFNNGLLLLPVM